jgi:hypothetical protein
MADYVIMNGELYHHGIPGMKWGIRRYQNKDGTLTAAGKKRYDKEMEKAKAEQKIVKNREKVQAKVDKLNALKADTEARKKALDGKKDEDDKKEVVKEKEKKAKKKTVKEMTDEELAAAIRRTQLEQQYANLHPKQVSAGEEFLKKTIIPNVAQVGVNLAKELITKKGREYLGLTEKKTEDPMADLRKKVEKLDLQKRLKEHTNPDATAELRKKVDLMDLNKRLNDHENPDPVSSLKKEVDRLTLEKRYNDLTNPSPSPTTNNTNNPTRLQEEYLKVKVKNKGRRVGS